MPGEAFRNEAAANCRSKQNVKSLIQSSVHEFIQPHAMRNFYGKDTLLGLQWGHRHRGGCIPLQKTGSK